MGAVDKIKEALRTALPSLAVSSGSIEQKIIDVVGTYADSEAIERENTLTTIRTALANQKTTSIEYYRRKAVEFQVDTPIDEATMLDPINFGFRYTSIDPAKQIIKQACIVGDFPNYVMRVNKFDEATQRLAALTDDEKEGFDNYFAYFQPLGLNMDVQSYDPAIITDPNLVVYIAGGYDGTVVAQEINQAFIDKQKELRRTNKVTISELVDTIQSVAGVRAVGFSNSLSATDTNLQGSQTTIIPEAGIFNLFTNAFVFGKSYDGENVAPITADMIKVLQ
jgi:hypothetical protein